MEGFYCQETEKYYEGVIIELGKGTVLIDLDGEKGQIRLAENMLISQDKLREGQVVGFLMTCPEVIFDKVDDGYVRNARKKYHEKFI